MVFVEDEAYEGIGPPDPQRRGREPTEAPTPSHLQPARCANDRELPSQSVGSANGGRLVGGCQIPPRGPGYASRSANRWGTDETVALLQWAAARVAAARPGTVPVVIRDLSRKGGGRLRPHRSHQSGRDADVGYFARNNTALTGFVEMGPGNIDLDKTWLLIEALLSTGRVKYIFVDYELQALLVQWLEDLDANRTVLGRLFQYPAGPGVARGVIRHARGHRDHFHVRFSCSAADDEACED